MQRETALAGRAERRPRASSTAPRRSWPPSRRSSSLGACSSNEPEIEGDLTLHQRHAGTASASSRFGSWLAPDQAQKLEALVIANLRERGEGLPPGCHQPRAVATSISRVAR